jgi:hypothetical protein
MAALFLSLETPAPLQVNSAVAEYITGAVNTAADCDGVLLDGHCCASAAGATYAQMESPAATFDELINRYGLPGAEVIRIEPARAPNPRPPRQLRQA